MTTFSRLITAATLISATAFVPGLAIAEDRQERFDRRDDREERFDRRDDREERFDRRDHDDRSGPAARHVHDRTCGHDARFLPPPAAPAWATRDDQRWDGRSWVRAGWGRQQHGQRFAQARAVRFELAELERDHATFHARFAYQPRKLARFEARYHQQRAALERRLQTLTWYAWR